MLEETWCAVQIWFYVFEFFFDVIYYQHYDSAAAPFVSWYQNLYWQWCIGTILNKRDF